MRYRVWNITWPEDDGRDLPASIVVSLDETRCDGVAESIELELIQLYDLWDQQKAPTFEFREITDHHMIGVVALTLGTEDRAYAGPEEGGWWYDKFEPTRVFYVARSRAATLRRRLQRMVDAENEGRPPISSVASRGRAALYEGIVGRTPRPTYS